MAKNIKIGIKLPSNNQLKAEIQSAIKLMEKHATLDFKIDTKEFTKSLTSMSKELDKLKTQLSKFNVLESIQVDSSQIKKAKQEVKELGSELSKTSGKGLASTSLTQTKDGISEVYKYKDSIAQTTAEVIKNGEVTKQTVTENIAQYEKLKNQLQTNLNKVIGSQYIDEDIIVNLQKEINSLSTNTSVESFNKLKNAIDNVVESNKTLKTETEQRLKVEQDYDNAWQKLLKNRELQEQASYQKSLNNINKLKEQLQGKLNTASSNELIDISVINKLKYQLESISTDTPEKEINELKAAIDNLAASDKQIVRLQNAITKYGISIDNLTDKYKDLPAEEFDDAILKIEKLEDVLSRIKGGESFTNVNISKILNEASASMTKFGNTTRNANQEVVTFGSAFKDIASKVGVFNIVDDAINKMKTGLSEGVRVVIDMDTEMSNLKKVIDGLSDKQLIQMRDTAVELGVALGRSSTDIMASFAEFGKQFKDTDIVTQLSELSVMAANTMENISSGEVANSLTTILKSMELGVSDAKKILDGLNEIQNNYRINSSDLLSGLAQIGSVAKTSGVELDRLNGYITSIVTTTGDSGSEVGNALQTILSRLYSTAKKTLEGIGVAVQDANGEFRSATDILDDYYKKWQTMSDTEKISSAQSIAGVNRYNQLVALMNNYDTALQAAETSLNSLDSMQKENETYLNSIEGKLASLKTATEGFWYNLISSDMIKSGVGTLESLIKSLDGLQNTFGSLGLSVGVLSTAFLTFTNNPMKKFLTNMVETEGVTKGFANIFKNLKQEISSAGTTMGVAQKSVLSLKSAYEALGIKAMVTQAKVALLQATLSMGISLLASWAIGGIISSFTSVEDRIEATNEKAKELSNTLSNFQDNKADLSRYEEIKKILDKTNVSEEERKSLNEELEEVKSRLSTMDSEAQAILDNTNLSYKEQLQLLKQINEQKVKEMAMELDKSLGNGFWGQDEEKNAKQAAESLNIQASLYKEAQDKFKNASSETITLSNGVTLAVKDQDGYLGKLKDSMNDNLLTVQRYNSNVELIEKANINSSRSTVELNNEVKDFTLSLNDSMEALDNNKDNVEDLVKVYESLGYSAEEAREKIEELNSINGTDGIGVSVEDATKAYGEAVDKVQELDSMLQKINEQQALTPDIVSELAKNYSELGAGITDITRVQEFLNNKIQEQVAIQQEAYQIMVGDDAAYYESRIKNSQNAQNIFDEFASQFVDVNGESYDFDLKNFATLNEAKAEFINQLSVPLSEFLANLIGGSAKGYEQELRNTKSYAEAKALILRKLSEQVAKVENQITNLVASSQAMKYAHPDAAWEEYIQIDALKQQLESLKAEKADIETSFNEFYASFNTSTPTFGKGSSSSSGSSGSSGSSSSSKEVADLEDLTKRYHDLEDAITDCSNALSLNKLLQDNAKGQEKINLMKQEIELYKKQAEAVKKLNEEQKKEADELKSILSKQGVKFDSSGNINNYNDILTSKRNWANSLSGTAKENAIAQVKALAEQLEHYDELVNNLIPKQEQEWQSLANTIKDVYKQQAEAIADQEKQIYDTIKYYAELATKKKKEEIDKQIDLLNKSYEAEENEENLNKQRQKVTELLNEMAKYENAVDAKGKKKYQELLAEYESQQAELNNMIKEAQKESMLESMEAEKEKLEEDLEDLLSPSNMNKLIADALSSGMIEIGGEVVDLQKAMTSMLEETTIGTQNLIQTNNEWINSLKEAMNLYSNISNINSNIGFNTSIDGLKNGRSVDSRTFNVNVTVPEMANGVTADDVSRAITKALKNYDNNFK